MNETESSVRKPDARTRYTKRIIKRTFLELLKEKPIRAVTVKELCARAEINRTTFYNHFMDIYDVQEQVERDLLEQLQLRMGQYTGRELLLIIRREVRDHREEMAVLLERLGDQGFLARMAGGCHAWIAAHPPEQKSAAHDFLTDPKNFGYFAGGIGGVIGWWIKSGMKESPEEIADYIGRCSSALWEKDT